MLPLALFFCLYDHQSAQKNADPSGLAKKATANVASDWSISVEGDEAAKNNAGKTRTAALA